MAKKHIKSSRSRLQSREVEKKFMPTFKALTKHLHQTGPVTNDFLGYKVPAGKTTDSMGREWQLQAHAILAKKKHMKKDEVAPMVRTWAIGMKLRVLAKYIVDWSSK